jgi:hypothetical protein
VRLPRVSGNQAVEALLRAGFEIHRIRGSHYILKNPETSRTESIRVFRTTISILRLHKSSDSLFSESGLVLSESGQVQTKLSSSIIRTRQTKSKFSDIMKSRFGRVKYAGKGRNLLRW